MPTAIADDIPKGGLTASLKSTPATAALMAELVESSQNLPNSSSSLGSIRLGLSEIKARVQELRKEFPVENTTKA